MARRTSYIKKPKQSNPKGFSATKQLQHILGLFPEADVVKSKGNSFDLTIEIRPTPISKKYKVRIKYDKFSGVEVFVTGEKLAIAHNRTKLPHVYSHDKQELCLYSPGKREWTRNKLISSTIIPWASEWLQFYELWLIDGDWLGGGHDEYGNFNKSKNER